MNEHYAYEPNAGGLERWPSQEPYESTFSIYQERTQPVNWLRWPAFPFDSTASLEQQTVVPAPESHAAWLDAHVNGTNDMDMEWNSRGHRVARLVNGASGGLNTASGVRFNVSNGLNRLVEWSTDISGSWFMHAKFKPVQGYTQDQTIWGIVDPDSTAPPSHRYSLRMKRSAWGTMRVRYVASIGGAITDYDVAGFTLDDEGYFDVGIMRWYLNSTYDWLLFFDKGVQRGGYYQPAKQRLYHFTALEIGRLANGKELDTSDRSFNGRIAALSFWRDPLRTLYSTVYPWQQKFARDPWWFLRGPEYPYQEPPATERCFHGSLSARPAISASTRALARMGTSLSSQLAISASSRGLVAVDGDVSGPSSLSGDVSSRVRVKGDVRGRVAVRGDPWGQVAVDADTRVQERLKGDVWSRPAMSGSVSSRPAVTGDVRRC